MADESLVLPGISERVARLERENAAMRGALRDINGAATIAAALDDDDVWRMIRDRAANALNTLGGK